MLKQLFSYKNGLNSGCQLKQKWHHNPCILQDHQVVQSNMQDDELQYNLKAIFKIK